MGFNPRLAPYSATFQIDGDPNSDVEYNLFRAPAALQVVGVYYSNDAAIATATNTLLIAVGKSAGGTGTFATIASKAANATVAADTPYAPTLTTTTANLKLAAGDWIRLKTDETGTGLLTRAAVQIDYVIGYES